jgi:membrane protease YdiL (CAAX protease family)
VSLVFDTFAQISNRRVWTVILTAIGSLVASVAYMLPFFLAGIFYYLLSKKDRTRQISFQLKPAREFPLLILAGLTIITVTAYANSWICELIGYRIPDELIAPSSYDNPAVIVMYMTSSLAPAFAEEFLFRGVFYSELRPYGRTQAVLLSALLFALMHQNIGQIFYTFAAGIAMAYMYELTGSIWCGVFFHMINNELSVFSDVLINGRFGEAALTYWHIFEGIYCVLGLISIVLLVFNYKKKKSSVPPITRTGLYEASADTVEAYEQPLPCKAVLKGMLAPGFVIFTVLTVVLMCVTWLSLIFLNSVTDLGGYLS